MNHTNLPPKPQRKKTLLFQRFRSFALVRKLAILALLCVFLGSGGLLLNSLLLEPYRAQKDNDSIRSLYYGQDVPPPSSAQTAAIVPVEPKPAPIAGFADLRLINSDIIGWIQLPGTAIDYPVLQSSPDMPEYYLKRNYRKEYSSHGSIFLNAKSELASDRNLVLYGHSMNDGQMFSALLDLNATSYRERPVLQFDTAEQKSKWKIISILKTNTLSEQGEVFPFNRTKFQNDADYMNYIYQLRIRSIVNTPVDVKPSDRIVTLSTCSYEFEEFRTVVVAREVRDGEEETVDTKNALPNAQVVYPDCWYEKYGGTKPVWPATLQTAQEQGLVSWVAEN